MLNRTCHQQRKCWDHYSGILSCRQVFGIHLKIERPWSILFNSFEDRAPVDTIYGSNLIFKWLQWFDFKIGHQDSSPSHGFQCGMSHHIHFQSGDITKHLEKLEVHINEEIPDRDFSGLGVLDFEEWFAIWDMNFEKGSKKIYRTESIKLANGDEAAAKEEFDKYAKYANRGPFY